MKSLDKKKTKELDWEKEFDNLNWNTDKGIMTKARVIKQSTGETVGQITIPVTKEMVKTFIKTLLTRQRTELEQQKVMKENINKELDWEKTFYNNFCSRERNPYSNATFYIVDRNERNPEKYLRFISSLLDKQRTELLEEIKDLQTYVLFNDTEKLISLEQVINLLNKKL